MKVLVDERCFSMNLFVQMRTAWTRVCRKSTTAFSFCSSEWIGKVDRAVLVKLHLAGTPRKPS